MQIAPLASTSPRAATLSPVPTPSPLPMDRARPEVVAHRGVHDSTTLENTIEAYHRAATLGADLVEVDIRRTADGVMVLHHDAWIAGRWISRTNYADLPKLSNGRPIDTLQGLVDAAAGARGGPRLLIETKEFGYEADIVRTLRAGIDPSRFEFMSFKLDSVRALRQLAPDAKVGAVFGLIPDWKTGTWPISGAAMVSRARELQVDFVAIDRHIASNARLDALAGAGIPTAIWTVNERSDLERFLNDPRVFRVITDTPATAIGMLPPR
ncbi:MAG: glycerophosphodiester phosphodiesterase [Gaiellales bacterium]